MHTKKDCIAMLLAGGQGSRLAILTKDVAKPAVPFGGKYRIIDFTLSNCINSGIDTVGVLTQYMPLELNAYIGNGAPWDLDRNAGGVSILPPYMKGKQGEWYKGTANAIYQNIPFIEQYDPEYVVVLSGDHIYKMDYSKMVAYHKAQNAACTIAVLNVPLEEAHRFGIMNTDENNRIYEFEEKPANPKSTKASMGVYVFTWSLLKQYLEEDEAKPESDNDFGKNVIPAMLGAGCRMFAYEFDGYWKDVGTLGSLWEANRELLGEKPAINLNDKTWRVLTRSENLPPHFVAENAAVENCIVSEGAAIFGEAKNSIISTGCVIEKGAKVHDTILMPYAHVMDDATVEYAIIGPEAIIGAGAKVGQPMDADRTGIEPDKMAGYMAVVGNGFTISDGSVVPAASIVTENR